jgi:hypothetical protein
VAGALRAVLTVHAHQGGLRLVPTGYSAGMTLLLFSVLGGGDAASSAAGLLHALRAKCGLTREEEATLRQEVLPTLMHTARASADALSAALERVDRRAAEDVARHGLRACALPGCSATEPQPKAFKVCGRCRGVVYCCAAHQAEDWRRHKRADGCQASAN